VSNKQFIAELGPYFLSVIIMTGNAIRNSQREAH